MSWKLKPLEPISNYSSTMKFYKVSTKAANWNLDMQTSRKYKRWAWESCGGTWAISTPRIVTSNSGIPSSAFFVGFESGEDRIAFQLSHEHEVVTILEKNLKVFVREKQ